MPNTITNPEQHSAFLLAVLIHIAVFAVLSLSLYGTHKTPGQKIGPIQIKLGSDISITDDSFIDATEPEQQLAPPIAPQPEPIMPEPPVVEPAVQTTPQIINKTAPAKPKKVTKQASVKPVAVKKITSKVRGVDFGSSNLSSGQQIERYTKKLWHWAWASLKKRSEIKVKQRRAVVYIEINRNGSLQHSELIQSSGLQQLDDIIMQSVNAASPYPNVPSNYPNKNNTLAFELPFKF